MESVGIEPRTSPPVKVLAKAIQPTHHTVLFLQIISHINTLTVIPKTTHQAKRLKKNTNAEKYIALVNAETWLAVVDKYLDATV
jgi:hypothetical protein